MRTFFAVIVLLLFFAAGVSAFTPGPTTIRECPKCRVPIEQATMASGNTIGARHWSDGKMEALMLPDYPWLVKCPKCKRLFWIDEAKKLGDTRKGWKGQGKAKSYRLEIPTVSDFYSVVARVMDKRKQMYIRTRLWHCANDPYRGRIPHGKVDLSAQAKANMKALSRVLNEKNPEERFMKAEIDRELGLFDQCLKLLNTRFTKDLDGAASAIKMLAQERYTPVMEFSSPSRESAGAVASSTVPTAIENRLFLRAMKESCVYIINGLLASYSVDGLLQSGSPKLKAAIAAGAAQGDNSAAAVVLDTAVDEGSVKAARFLLDSGARVNGRSTFRLVTPLITACWSGNESMADFLIGRGADVNAEADYGLTPLTIVCRKRYVGLARVLLDKGAKVDQGSGSDTPLMTLCTYTGDWPGGARAVDWASKTLELTKLLIDHGANVNGTEPAVGSSEYGLGSTPLIEICSIEFSGDGFVPVSYTKEEKVACEAVYSDVIRLLLDNKADINKCDNYGESPLAYACEAGNLWAVKLLLERGADVNKASKDGTTPLGIANKLPDKAIAKLLLEHGAKSNAGK